MTIETIGNASKRFAKHKGALWFVTNIEICDYVQAYKSLRYSADGHTIYNPTLLTVWLDIDCKIYSVKSGETIKII